MVSAGIRCRAKTEVAIAVGCLLAGLRVCGGRYGDVDLGIVGYDMFSELAEEDPDLVLIHEALDFGKCQLSLGVPISGTFASINTLEVHITPDSLLT